MTKRLKLITMWRVTCAAWPGGFFLYKNWQGSPKQAGFLLLHPGSGCEVLWWVCLSVGLSVCLPVCQRGYLRNHTRDLCQIFMHVAYVRGSVLLRHVYDRPHRLSPGRGFLPHWKCIIGRERGTGVHNSGEVCCLRLPCCRYYYAKVPIGPVDKFTIRLSLKQHVMKVESESLAGWRRTWTLSCCADAEYSAVSELVGSSSSKATCRAATSRSCPSRPSTRSTETEVAAAAVGRATRPATSAPDSGTSGERRLECVPDRGPPGALVTIGFGSHPSFILIGDCSGRKIADLTGFNWIW